MGNPASGRGGSTRCEWGSDDPVLKEYHDREWGVPQHDDRILFEFLMLEGAQAGLSWLTILKKRPAYRKAFDKFDPRKVARYGKRKVASLLSDKSIVRNRLKIQATIRNAQRFLEVATEFGSFDRYIWDFVRGGPKTNRWRRLSQIPASTRESDSMSSDLRRREFTFVGTTICYAFMQAVGMVNDHVVQCFRHAEISKLASPDRTS